MANWLSILSALLAVGSDVATPTFRVRVGDRASAGAVEAALTGASRRLTRPGCARVFRDFSDRTGHALQQNLDTLGHDGPAYLRLVVFADGTGHRSCRGGGGPLAVTAPGARVVFVCPRFRAAQWQKPDFAEAVLIHETLHTLGLPENPPSSDAITKRVLARCGTGER